MANAGRKRILVVEDDAAIAKMLEKVLAADYDVTLADNGAKALDAARKSRPHLVLLDVMVPGMNGFDLAKRLRIEPGFAKTPVIFLTARDAPMDVVRGIQVGARHYLTKPFKLEEVRDKVAKTLK